MKISIRNKLIILFLIVSLLPLSFMTVITYKVWGERLKNNIGANLATISKQTMALIDRHMYFAKEDLRAWSLMQAMQDVIAADLDGRITATLIRLKQERGVYSGIFCLDQDGIIVAASETDVIGRDASGSVWFKDCRDSREFVIKDFAFDPYTGEYSVILTIPVYPLYDAPSTSEPIGYLSSHLNWKAIKEITDAVDVNEHGQNENAYIVLIDNSGNLITAPDFLLSQSSAPRPDNDSHDSKNIKFSNINFIEREFNAAKRALNKENGFVLETGNTDQEYMVGFAGSGGYLDFANMGWGVLALQDARDAFMPITLLRKQFLIIGFITSLAVSLLAILMAQKISDPIQKLTQFATQIKEGKSYGTINVNSRDEIGDLAIDFNSMAEQIKERTHLLESEITERMNAEANLKKHQLLLEDKVTERTEKLTITNEQLEKEIKERQTIADQLKLSKEEAETANRLKSEFLANMSHEIRTPLNAILGFAGIIGESTDDIEMINYAGIIRSSGTNLLQLINDILDLSKIEAGKLTLDYHPVSIETVLNEISQIFSIKVTEKKLDFQIDLASDMPSFFMLDENRLRQILFNLVGNAIKFTDTGFVKIAVVPGKGDTGNGIIDIIILVEDSGIGIPAEQSDMIFDAFKQVDGQSCRKFGGTGLGLSITKKLVEAMDGRISLSSIFGKGSIFKIELDGIRICTSKTLNAVPSENDAVNAFVDFNNSKVLIVDDDKLNRDLIKNYLSATNVIIFEAVNGRQAIDKAREFHPDIILMDIRMPVMDGYDSISQLKNDPAHRSTPIIVITASVMEDEVEKIKATGCSIILEKPIDKKKLISSISQFLNSNNNGIPREATDSYTSHSPEDQTKQSFKTGALSQVFGKTEAVTNTPKTGSICFSGSSGRDRIANLVDLLENEWLDRCRNLAQAVIIDDAEVMAADAIDFGENNGLSPLLEWGEELKLNLLGFNTSKIKETLNRYGSVLAGIKEEYGYTDHDSKG